MVDIVFLIAIVTFNDHKQSIYTILLENCINNLFKQNYPVRLLK